MAITVINLFLILLFCIIAVSFGAYTLLLQVVVRFRKIDHRIDTEFCPTITILIAAYNEGAVLQEKLENTIAIEYPAEKLKVVVVSDGSTDNTVELAKQFEQHGIELIACPVNKGKATALNLGMEKITSELVVLSDANVLYQSDALRKLARHFADPTIGAVSGKVVLLNEGLSYSNAENAYYSVEHNIQELESNTGNLIGADGAMYAIRRTLFRPLLPDTLLDDLVLSMGVVQQGSRLIFDGQALGFEKNIAELDLEYKRKVRIVAGGMQSLKRKSTWPPTDQPLTILKFVCHKVLRWMIGPVIILFIGLFLLNSILSQNLFMALATSLFLIGCLTTMISIKLFPSLLNFKLIRVCKYLLVMIKASVVGSYKGLFSNKKVKWR